MMLVKQVIFSEKCKFISLSTLNFKTYSAKRHVGCFAFHGKRPNIGCFQRVFNCTPTSGGNLYITSLLNRIFYSDSAPKQADSWNAIQQNLNVSPEGSAIEDPYVIQVAVVGLPNSGKSTLINQLIGRRAFSTSKKVHTTRCKARAVMNYGNTQVIFLDTPGLVSADEMERYNLEKSFIADAERSMKDADLIAVVHDVSNKMVRHSLGPKILRLLHLYPEKESILILNKTDLLIQKRKLLLLTEELTKSTLKMKNESKRSDIDTAQPLSELQVKQAIEGETGWDRFTEVFMISALTGSGSGDVKEYLLQHAKPRPWVFLPSFFTDQRPEDMVVEAVREKMLEYLPNEIPYLSVIELEHFHVDPVGSIVAVVLVRSKKPKRGKLLIGRRGTMVKKIAMQAEQVLANSFQQNVRLRVVVDVDK